MRCRIHQPISSLEYITSTTFFALNLIKNICICRRECALANEMPKRYSGNPKNYETNPQNNCYESKKNLIEGTPKNLTHRI